ncbi:MAG: hypothetical protein RLZZ414_2192 [Bacteroidota bacterium]|jgi:hypothetical protein
MLKIKFILFVLFTLSFPSYSFEIYGDFKSYSFMNFTQDADKNPDNSTKKTKTPRSPGRAALYSIIPGGGQIYNRKFWKLPIYYGLGYLIFTDYQANNAEKNFNFGLLKLKDQDASRDAQFDYVENFSSNHFQPLNASTYVENSRAQILQQYQSALGSLQRNFMFFGFLYGLGFIDAMVDAHFSTYDISDDLTLKWQPTLIYSHNKNIAGLSFSLHVK